MKTWKRVTLMAIGIVSTWFIIGTGMNYAGSYQEHIDENSHSVMRADGPFSHTSLRKYRDGDYKTDKVDQYNLVGATRCIEDESMNGELDGLVDRIHIMDGSYNVTFFRDADYELNKEEFANADKLLADTKERFKGHFQHDTLGL